MTSRILILQFREQPEPRDAERICIERALAAGGSELTFVNAFDKTLNWERPRSILRHYDGIILGGSGEFFFDGKCHPDDPKRERIYSLVERMRPFVRRILHTDFPTLGICMGHQVIAHVLGTPIFACGKTGKTGTYDITLTKEGTKDKLFGKLSDQFSAQYAHKDVLESLPVGAVVLANGTRCGFGVLRYGENVYTTQFHPELTRDDMLKRMESHPHYLPEGETLETCFRETPDASLILGAFVTAVVEPEARYFAKERVRSLIGFLYTVWHKLGNLARRAYFIPRLFFKRLFRRA